MSSHCQVMHAIRGRLRLRVEIWEYFNGKASAFAARLKALPGVRGVRLNGVCYGVIIDYDPGEVDSQTLLTGVRELTPAGLSSQGRQADGSNLAGSQALVQNGALALPQNGAANRPEPDESRIEWLPLGLSTAAVITGVVLESALTPFLLLGAAVPIFKRAIESLCERRKLNVDVLDATATVFLALRAQYVTASIMVWLISLGDFIRSLTMRQSRRAIESLVNGKVKTAWRLRDGRIEQIRLAELAVGDDIVVYPGELVPADGQITSGVATIDQSMLTGESMPVEKEPEDAVFSGTVVRDGKIYVKVEKVGAETMAARIVRLVEEAPLRDTRVQNYAEHFADRVVPWSLLGGGVMLGLGRVGSAAAIVIADFATGIRVAAPTTILSAMARAARQGVLVKGGGRYLERLAEVDAIVFDKTGTLTHGTPELLAVTPYGAGVREADVLRFAAAAEQHYHHPLARAIERTAHARGLAIPQREDSDYTIGLGLSARVDGQMVRIGCQRFMERWGISIQAAQPEIARIERRAATPLFLALDEELSGVLAFADPVQQEAPAVIRALHQRGIRMVAMLTGDRPAVARRVAGELGVARYTAEALPEEKLAFVRDLQAEGFKVAVVGDGINDSPALAQADVGIAVGSGADIALEAAHIILLRGDLWKVPQAIDISRQAMGLVEQNWHWNFYPNALVIALSLMGLLGPIGATLISNGSAVAATLNGLRPLLGGPQNRALTRDLRETSTSEEASDSEIFAPQREALESTAEFG